MEQILILQRYLIWLLYSQISRLILKNESITDVDNSTLRKIISQITINVYIYKVIINLKIKYLNITLDSFISLHN